MTNEDKINDLKNTRENKLNMHLSNLEKEIYEAVKYSAVDKLKSLGCNDETPINFMIELQKEYFYPILLLASSIGNSEVIATLLQNKTIDINIQDPTTHVNAFWVAAFYGKGECLKLLAKADSNIL